MAKRPTKPATPKVSFEKPATLVGTQLGDYKLRELLATGGMARIYKAEDVKLGRMAAVKVLTRAMVESDESLGGRFQREAKAVAQLEHDNIITIFQYGEQDDLYFLAMKFVEGGDLADELNALQRQARLMEPSRLLTILGQVAAALDYSHQHGIIHRDVKPSNILMDKSGKAILTDFGLVLKQHNEQTIDKTQGTAFGTPRYISPEQALASEKAVPQSDVYSLAVILYEGLTGSMVFKADTAMQIALSHISEPPPLPRSINPNIPRAVERELLKALEKDPKKRHKTATEFIKAVREAYGDELNRPQEDIPVEILRSATPVFKTDPRQELFEAEKQRAAEAARKNNQASGISAPQKMLDDTPTVSERNKRVRPRRRRRPLLILILLGLLVAVLGATAYYVLERQPNARPAAQANDDGGAIIVAIPTLPPAPTAVVSLPEGGEPVTLLYGFDVLALRNDGTRGLDIAPLTMGTPRQNTFRGSSVTDGLLPPGECVVIARSGREVEIPSEWGCGAAPYSANTLDNSVVFWRNTTDDTFEVRAGGVVVATCAAVDRTVNGMCELTWPLLR